MSVGNRIYASLQGDKAVWMILAILSLISMAVVYSATSNAAFRMRAGNTEYYLTKHLIFIVGGLFMTYLCYTMHYTRYKKMAPVFLILVIPLLVYTLAMGPTINNARRWLEIPLIGMTIQTSDFAKLALIIYVARTLSIKQEYIKDFQSAFLPIIVPVLMICGLIAPSDLSTGMILFFTCVLMMFIGRVDIRYIFLLLFLGLVVFAFLIVLGDFFPGIIRTDTWIERFQTYLTNPEGADQSVQAKIAIAQGGWFGQGPGNSILQNFLPAPYSDFIYAIICEEYGLIGGLILLGLYVLLFFRCTRIVTRAPKAFGAMLVMGLGLVLTIQALVNMAVAVHLVPVTGLTLPMVSMGGTSILFTSISFGIILSVSRYIEKVV